MKDELIRTLQKDGSSKNLERLAGHIIENKIPLDSLLDLLDQPRPVPMRFMWMVGGLCVHEPKIVSTCVEKFYLKRNDIKFPNYDRSLAKMFFHAGIPEELEGEIINELFKWLMDPKISVSTKHYALLTLNNSVIKFPELKTELKVVIEDQLDKNTKAWKKMAIKVLNGLI